MQNKKLYFILLSAIVAFSVKVKAQNCSVSINQQDTANLVVETRYVGKVGVHGTANGALLNATFDIPEDMVFAQDGSAFITDRYNQRIRKVTTQGQVITYTGSAMGYVDGSLSQAKFSGPSAIVIDPNGNLFIADKTNFVIRKIDTNGNVSTFAGSSIPGTSDGPANLASFIAPEAMAIDDNGDIYVLESFVTGEGMIRKIASNGYTTTVAGTLAVGYLDGPANFATFNFPMDIAVDKNGNVYVADKGNHAIRKLDGNGQVTTLAGGNGPAFIDGNGGVAAFHDPVGLTFNKEGDMVVTEWGNRSSYRIVTTTGSVSSVLMDSLVIKDLNYQLSTKHHKAVFDNYGALYITDLGLSFIRKIISGKSICAGDSIELTAKSAPGTTISTVQWINNTTGTVIGSTPSIWVSPNTATTFRVEITDNNGCTSNSEFVVFVDSVLATISSDTAICLGTPLSICASGGTQYSWSPNIALSSDTVACPVVNTSIDSAYNYNVVVSNKNGCSDSKQVNVTVHPQPVLEANQDTLICQGSEITLWATGADNYLWEPAELVDSADQNSTTATIFGSSVFTVTGSNTFGCKDSVTVKVEVSLVKSQIHVGGSYDTVGLIMPYIDSAGTPLNDHFDFVNDIRIHDVVMTSQEELILLAYSSVTNLRSLYKVTKTGRVINYIDSILQGNNASFNIFIDIHDNIYFTGYSDLVYRANRYAQFDTLLDMSSGIGFDVNAFAVNIDGVVIFQDDITDSVYYIGSDQTKIAIGYPNFNISRSYADYDGNVYFHSGIEIVKIDRDLNMSHYFTLSHSCSYISFDENGNIYPCDNATNDILKQVDTLGNYKQFANPKMVVFDRRDRKVTEKNLYGITGLLKLKILPNGDAILLTTKDISLVTKRYYCQGDIMDLHAELPSLNIPYQSSWYHDNILVGSSDSLSITVTNSDTVTYHLTDSLGCVSQIDLPFFVHQLNVDNDTLIPYGHDVEITATNKLIPNGPLELLHDFEYRWTPNLNIYDSSAFKTLAYPNDSIQYKVSVTTEKGCVFEDSIAVGVAHSELSFLINGDTTQPENPVIDSIGKNSAGGYKDGHKNVALFAQLWGTAIKDNGEIYIAGDDRVRKYDPVTQKVSTMKISGSLAIIDLVDIKNGFNDDLYYLTIDNGPSGSQIHRMTPFDTSMVVQVNLTIDGFTVDSIGNIYYVRPRTAVNSDRYLYKVDTTGNETEIFKIGTYPLDGLEYVSDSVFYAFDDDNIIRIHVDNYAYPNSGRIYDLPKANFYNSRFGWAGKVFDICSDKHGNVYVLRSALLPGSSARVIQRISKENKVEFLHYVDLIQYQLFEADHLIVLDGITYVSDDRRIMVLPQKAWQSCPDSVSVEAKFTGILPNSLAWDLGDTTIYNVNPLILPHNTLEQIQFTAQNAIGEKYREHLYLSKANKASFNLGPDHAVCDSIQLDGGENRKWYAWNTGDSSQFLTVDTTGLYFVESRGAFDCMYFDTIELEVNNSPPKPLLNVTDSLHFCHSTNQNIFVTNPSGYSYTWSTSDSGISIIAQHEGNYWVVALDTVNTCIRSSDTVNISITPFNDTIIVKPSLFICEGDTAYLTLPRIYDVYNWSNGANDPSIAVTKSGEFHVSLMDSAGCTTTSDTISLLVAPYPKLPYFPQTDTLMCEGQLFEINALDTASANPVYNWSTGDSTSSAFVSTGGIHKVVVSNESGCITEDSVEVFIDSLPKLDVKIIPNGGAVTFWNFSTYSDSYYFDFGDGTDDSTSSMATFVHHYPIDGNYTAMVVGDNHCGTDTFIKELDIVTSIKPIIASAAETIQFNIYPNPFATELYATLDIQPNVLVAVEIRNVQGAVIYRSEGQSNQDGHLSFNFSKEDVLNVSGLYFLRFTIDGRLYCKKVGFVGM